MYAIRYTGPRTQTLYCLMYHKCLGYTLDLAYFTLDISLPVTNYFPNILYTRYKISIDKSFRFLGISSLFYNHNTYEKYWIIVVLWSKNVFGNIVTLTKLTLYVFSCRICKGKHYNNPSGSDVIITWWRFTIYRYQFWK